MTVHEELKNLVSNMNEDQLEWFVSQIILVLQDENQS